MAVETACIYSLHECQAGRGQVADAPNGHETRKSPDRLNEAATKQRKAQDKQDAHTPISVTA